MPREVTIPVALWVCAALVSHAAIGGGAVGVTHVEEQKARERADIRDMVLDVRRGLGTIELDVGDSGSASAQAKLELSRKETELGKLGALLADPKLLPEEREDVERQKRELEKEIEQEIAEEKKLEEEKQEKKEEEPEEEPEKVAKPMELLPPPRDDRLKIRQAARDEKDNATAPRLAEHALSVEQEEIAKARSNNSVSENPSFDSNRDGPRELEGNAQNDKNAQTEDRPGDKKAAPGSAAEKALSDKSREGKAGVHGSKAAPAAGGSGGEAQPAVAQTQPGVEGGRPDPAHDHAHADHGLWDSAAPAPGGDGSGDFAGFGQIFVSGARVAVPGFVPRTPGFGGGPGGPGSAPSLGWGDFVAAIGEAALDEQSARIGEERKSARKGQFDTEKFARWLPDIENYDPSVKLGNQTRLNAAQSVFATYLSTLHNAIHPIFADEFLSSLNRLGKSHELNGEIVTHVEIILSRDEGKVVRMGVTKNSGFTLFDAAALEAIDRASPFGLVAPDAIVSPDGNVYLHWEFHRDPVDACSTRNASPFIIAQPKPLKSNIPKRKPKKVKKPTETPGGAVAPDAPSTEPLVPRRKSVGQGKATRKKK